MYLFNHLRHVDGTHDSPESAVQGDPGQGRGWNEMYPVEKGLTVAVAAATALTLGPEALLANLPRPWSMLSQAELSSIRGGAEAIGTFFKANAGSNSLVLTPGLTKEILRSYRQVALNAIAKYEGMAVPNQLGIQTQTVRLNLINQALKAVK